MTQQQGSPPKPPVTARAVWELPAYLLIGAFFGVVLVKSEVVSWFRIQEMFRFQSFFMYGVIGTAVATAGSAIFLLKDLGLRSLTDEAIRIAPKRWEPGAQHRYWIGGTIFGLGWGLAGACPGPIYALIGSGTVGALVVLLSALVGARTYAAVAHKLPH
jgi:uncharacterized membrane protein YedE/YeeE